MLSAPLMLVIIGLGSLLAQWLAWLLKIPAILPLLLLGVVLGPVTHVIQPDALFGNLLFPLVSISVAIILFEGALTLRVDEVRGLGGVVRNLVTIGMLVTFAVISLACWWLLGFEPELAALVLTSDGGLLGTVGATGSGGNATQYLARQIRAHLLQAGVVLQPFVALD